jgi:hypothetical protein
MTDDPFADLKKLRAPVSEIKAEQAPAKIQKRREHFIKVPMWWYEKLANPLPATRCTAPLALHLLYLNWKSRGEPFKLVNGTLSYDGISREMKTRALKDLEQRGLVSVEWRERKSPVVHVHTELPRRPN